MRMTNREKFREVYGFDTDCGKCNPYPCKEDDCEWWEQCKDHPGCPCENWWDNEYKAPAAKNDLAHNLCDSYTYEDMYDWLYRLKSELVVYMPREWHEPMRVSIQSAIAFSRKYQMLQAEYENLLKADKVAMLEEFDSQFDKICFYKNMGEWKTVPEIKAEYKAIIREKINELKGNQEGKNDKT